MKLWKSNISFTKYFIPSINAPTFLKDLPNQPLLNIRTNNFQADKNRSRVLLVIFPTK